MSEKVITEMSRAELNYLLMNGKAKVFDVEYQPIKNKDALQMYQSALKNADSTDVFIKKMKHGVEHCRIKVRIV